MTNPTDDSARDIEPRDIEPRDVEPRDDPSADDVAHGSAAPPSTGRTLVAVFASPVAGYLLRYGQDAGFRPVLVEPDPERARAAGGPGVTVVSSAEGELGIVLRDALASEARWVGIMGNPRHPAPHIPALTELGVPPSEIARVHRPIGLNIGSRTPAEIAIATLAGLIADRNERPGGLSF
jgi:xanthine dehydrogenase accessory factor